MKIDWNEQWALHAPTFKEGFAHISFGTYRFRLKPGPGFGDLSHPTTRLMLHLMPKKCSLPVVDLGSGSGVLSLAAAYAGAPQVFGVEHEPAALQHAKENAALNGQSVTFIKHLAKPPQTCLVLMNMISSEQHVVWKAHENLWNVTEQMVVSGIPIEERNDFLKRQPYGQVIEEHFLEGWIGLIIKRKRSN